MPTIPYPGGKGRLARTIVSFLPKRGRIFVEAFCGKGNVSWAASSEALKDRGWWLNDVASGVLFMAKKLVGLKLIVSTLGITV